MSDWGWVCEKGGEASASGFPTYASAWCLAQNDVWSLDWKLKFVGVGLGGLPHRILWLPILGVRDFGLEHVGRCGQRENRRTWLETSIPKLSKMHESSRWRSAKFPCGLESQNPSQRDQHALPSCNLELLGYLPAQKLPEVCLGWIWFGSARAIQKFVPPILATVQARRSAPSGISLFWRRWLGPGGPLVPSWGWRAGPSKGSSLSDGIPVCDPSPRGPTYKHLWVLWFLSKYIDLFFWPLVWN